MENKTKHTPGPWHLGGAIITGADDVFVGIAIFPPPIYGGKVHESRTSDTRGPKYFDESNANAALIAAAPELLEAVNKALEFIEQRMEAEFHINCSEVTDSLYKAIAKAEGK